MSVVAEYKKDGELLNLEIDKGDLLFFKCVMIRWNLKDEQAFWRFAVSILTETDQNSIGIWEKGNLIPTAPADHNIKK